MSIMTTIAAKIKALGYGIIGFFLRLINMARRGMHFILEKIPGKKERFLYFGLGAAVFVLIISMIILFASQSGSRSSRNTGRSIPARAIIPVEELFLPDEPDYIPGVMLERERRTQWTEEDAVPFWQDPLKNGEEHWRQQIETAIDELLERYP